MLSWAAEAFDRRSFLFPTGRRAGAETPPRKRQRPIGASLSRPAVLPVVGKSGSVLEPARNTHLPAATAITPSRSRHCGCAGEISRPPTSPARSTRVQGHTQGGRAEVRRLSPVRTHRRDCERICHTVGRDELPRCRARADSLFRPWPSTPKCAAPQDRFRRRHVSRRVLSTAGSSAHGELGSSVCLPRSRSPQQLLRNFALRFRSYEELLSVPSVGAGRRR